MNLILKFCESYFLKGSKCPTNTSGLIFLKLHLKKKITPGQQLLFVTLFPAPNFTSPKQKQNQKTPRFDFGEILLKWGFKNNPWLGLTKLVDVLRCQTICRLPVVSMVTSFSHLAPYFRLLIFSTNCEYSSSRDALILRPECFCFM